MKTLMTMLLLVLLATSVSAIGCLPPYKTIGNECCIDKNSNGICDWDDALNCTAPRVIIHHFCCLDANQDGMCDLTPTNKTPITTTLPTEPQTTITISTPTTTTTTIPSATTTMTNPTAAAVTTTIYTPQIVTTTTTTSSTTTTTIIRPTITTTNPVVVTTSPYRDGRITPLPTSTTVKNQPSVGITETAQSLLGNPAVIIAIVVVVVIGFIYKIGTKTEQEKKPK